MTSDPKQFVADGYDEIAPRYLAWSALAPSPERMEHLRLLLDLLPPGAEVGTQDIVSLPAARACRSHWRWPSAAA